MLLRESRGDLQLLQLLGPSGDLEGFLGEWEAAEVVSPIAILSLSFSRSPCFSSSLFSLSSSLYLSSRPLSLEGSRERGGAFWSYLVDFLLDFSVDW